MEPEFLTLDEALAIQAEQIERYGGTEGVRDHGLLASALAMPAATYGGQFLHPNLFEMAAAYLFHLCKNHPFLDGNKRTALAASLAFLWLNDLEVVADPDEIAELVLGVADGSVGKAQVAVYLEERARQL
ncbi:MAG: type II toxin-antitoxin system death-on-curing family toxin [Acidobacteriota bacterium]|nr:type II toxin-antitoxin system death-on-curing family toxin [Acidobacteriota bacterium]